MKYLKLRNHLIMTNYSENIFLDCKNFAAANAFIILAYVDFFSQ